MRDRELASRVHAESDSILQTNDCRQVHTTFAAFGSELKRLEMSPERLLSELVRGSQYLVDRDPRVLSWIMDYQRPHFPWPDYPIEGTP